MIKAAYIHIPFCHHICHYCDFNKFYLKDQPVIEYLHSLKTEMEVTLQAFPTKNLSSIFIGGGTPTALNIKQLSILMESIQSVLPYNKYTEFTVEANPGDLSIETLKILYESGVNRLSFGVQSFNDELLKRIGRSHQAKDVYRSIELAKSVGFENISIDLIFGLPGQSLAEFKKTLSAAFSLNIPHYAGYSLIVEPKTVFYQLLKKGRLPLPGEEVEATMYVTLMEEMDKYGFEQYEISNFSKKGYESKHNLVYWNNNEYYGFGAGAHSYMVGSRRSNAGPLKKYMEPLVDRKLPLFEEHVVTEKEKMEEEMFLGLRKLSGVSISMFEKKFSKNPLKLFANEINQLMERGLIQLKDDNISLTKQGKLLGNEVFQTFIDVI